MEKYDVQKLLGKGSFGSVYHAKRIVDNAMLVMKKVNIGDLPQKEKDAAMLEVKVLQRMHHPAIVGLENFFIFKNRQLCIVMELCEGGDLSQYLAKKTPSKQFLPEELVLDWFLQVCLAIQYMHEQKIMHRDIKSQNVFLTKDNRVKLGDFGIAKVLAGTNQMAKTVIGTPYYMSPEQFRNQPYSFKSDVWSLGCLLYEMCCLRHAFEARDMDGLVKKIMRCNYSAIPSMYSSGVQNLVKALLQLAPTRRPSVAEILAMPVLRERMRLYLRQQLGDVELENLVLENAKELSSSDPGELRGVERMHLLRQAAALGLKADTPSSSVKPALSGVRVSDSGPHVQKQLADAAKKEVIVSAEVNRVDEVILREQRAKERAEQALRKLQEEKLWRAKQAQLHRQRISKMQSALPTPRAAAPAPPVSIMHPRGEAGLLQDERNKKVPEPHVVSAEKKVPNPCLMNAAQVAAAQISLKDREIMEVKEFEQRLNQINIRGPQIAPVAARASVNQPAKFGGGAAASAAVAPPALVPSKALLVPKVTQIPAAEAANELKLLERSIRLQNRGADGKLAIPSHELHLRAKAKLEREFLLPQRLLHQKAMEVEEDAGLDAKAEDSAVELQDIEDSIEYAPDDVSFEDWLHLKREELEKFEKDVERHTLAVQLLQLSKRRPA